MATVKKKAVKKAIAPAVTPPVNPKLHVILGDATMVKFERKCKKVGMRKSDVTRILVEFFIKNELDITPAFVTKRG